jgi:hypothetical protein
MSIKDVINPKSVSICKTKREKAIYEACKKKQIHWKIISKGSTSLLSSFIRQKILND